MSGEAACTLAPGDMGVPRMLFCRIEFMNDTYVTSLKKVLKAGLGDARLRS